jgi:hypothetical protein
LIGGNILIECVFYEFLKIGNNKQDFTLLLLGFREEPTAKTVCQTDYAKTY